MLTKNIGWLFPEGGRVRMRCDRNFKSLKPERNGLVLIKFRI